MTAFPTLSSKQEIEEGQVLAPKFDRDRLITCVATEAGTGEVLMVAHMNADALRRSIETSLGDTSVTVSGNEETLVLTGSVRDLEQALAASS